MELKNKSKIDYISKISEIIFIICACISILSVVVITLYMIISGLPAIQEIGLFDFIFGTDWNPTGKDPSYGIFAMILASIYATFGAIVIGVPTGLLTAVFLSEIAPKNVKKAIVPLVEILAGIPSVIYGFVGLLVLVPFVAKVFDLSFGASLFSSIIVLAIMILPTIIAISQTTLESLPRELKEASLALGATRVQTIFRVLIPAAKSGIITGVVLGIGRAIGETMAIIMVSGNTANMPELFGTVRLMTSGIVSEMAYASAFHKEALFAIGLVLFVFIMAINIVLNLFLRDGKNK